VSHPSHRVPRAEYDDHIVDFPPTCLCAPVIVEETLHNIDGSPFIEQLVVYHTAFTLPDYPVPVEYL